MDSEKAAIQKTSHDRLFILTQEIKPNDLEMYVKNASPNSTGDLGYLYEIYYKIRQFDPRIGSAIDKRIENLVHLNYTVRPGTEDDLSIEAAAIVKKAIKKMKFSEFLEDMFDGKLMGASVMELHWGQWENMMLPIHPRQVPYSRLSMIAQKHDKDEEWGKLAIKDHPFLTTKLTTIDSLKEEHPNRIVCAYGRQKDGFYDASGIMRSIIKMYIIKYYAILFWTQSTEKNEEPYMIGKLPERLFEKYKSKMERVLKNKGRDKHAVILEEMLIEAVNTGGNPDVYKKLIDYVDECAVIKILGNNLTTKVSGGSFAASETHESGEMRKLVSDSSWSGEIMNDQIIPSIMATNMPDLPIEMYPEFEFNLPQNVDEFQEIRKLSEASRSVPVPVAEFYSKGGIRPPEKDDNGEITEEVVESGSNLDQLMKS